MNKMTNRMEIVELMQYKENTVLVRTHGQHKNTALHCTEAGQGHAFLVVSVIGEEDAVSAARASYAMIADTLFTKRMEIVHERIFGSLSVEAAVLRERMAALSERHIPADGPVTIVEGNPPWGEGLAGMIIHAVSSGSEDDVWTIMDEGKTCGRGWRSGGLTYLMLQNIQGQAGSRTGQVRAMLDRAESILRQNGSSYKDVARTWFYLSEILDWYPEFNKARSGKYGELSIMPGSGDYRLLLPASTGIGANTPSGAAASMDLLAVVENNDRTSPVRKLTNREQLDAVRYGSAFSRGAVMEEDGLSFIQVSGTAAIDEHGVSLYPCDIRAQIDCTLDKIETLLGQEGAGLTNICEASVFVKRPEYAEVFRETAADRGLADFPAVCVLADLCREELLFEMDAEAMVRK